LRIASPARFNTAVCSECATVQPEPALRCYRCAAPLIGCRRVRTTHSAIVFEVEHPQGSRIVKMLRNRDDSAGIRRYERERQVLSVLADRTTPGLIPRIIAAAPGILITDKLSGRRVHDLLWWPTTQRIWAVRKAGESARLLAETPLDDVSLPPHTPIELDGYLLLVGEMLPHWIRREALAAAAETNRSAFVHGDFVPTNWLWDGTRTAVLDFEWARMGNPEEDVAMAWARLRLAGVERGVVNDRLASEVIRHWLPEPSIRWRSYALVKTVAIILARMRRRPDPFRQIETRLLRRTLDLVVQKLA
jgi:Phosphotransferase enzyme family